MAKEETEEKLAKVESERDKAIKALEEEKANWRAAEEQVRKEAFDEAEEVVADILKFKISFRRSALFMIKQKYLELDLYNVYLT